MYCPQCGGQQVRPLHANGPTQRCVCGCAFRLTRVGEDRVCAVCGQTFRAKRIDTKVCGNRCRTRASIARKRAAGFVYRGAWVKKDDDKPDLRKP